MPAPLSYNTRKPFSIEEGIKVRDEQLKRWKTILKPEAYNALVIHVTSPDSAAKTGYDIVRGTEMDQFLSNLSRKNNFDAPPAITPKEQLILEYIRQHTIPINFMLWYIEGLESSFEKTKGIDPIRDQITQREIDSARAYYFKIEGIK